MKIYRWSEGRNHSIPANVVARELLAIQRRDGQIEAAKVLAAARPAKSRLHPLFEWDDRKAAEQHRLEQARHIIRHVLVVERIGDKDREIRAFVSYVPADEPETGLKVYKDVRSAMENLETREQILERAINELLSWKERYEHLKEFADIIAAIERRTA